MKPWRKECDNRTRHGATTPQISCTTSWSCSILSFQYPLINGTSNRANVLESTLHITLISSHCRWLRLEGKTRLATLRENDLESLSTSASVCVWWYWFRKQMWMSKWNIFTLHQFRHQCNPYEVYLCLQYSQANTIENHSSVKSKLDFYACAYKSIHCNHYPRDTLCTYYSNTA